MSESRIELGPEWADDPWFRFPRAFIRDASLSWKAKGVAALLASHSPTFRFSADELSKWAKDGRDGTRAALVELEKAGYLTRTRAVDEETGRATGMLYQLHTKPQVGPQTGFPSPGKPSPGKPSPGKTADPYKESTLEGYHSEVEHPEGQDSCPSADGPTPSESRTVNAIIDAEFADWWAVYPRKVAKGQAERAYRTARKNGASQADLLEGIAAAVRAWKAKQTDTQFMPYPATWLNGKRWLDDLSAVSVGGAGSPVRRTAPGPGVVHTAEERAQQQESFAAMPQATPITPEELEALFRDQ